MTLEEAQKKIDSQRIVIDRFASALRRKNETIEQLGEIIRQLEMEVAKYRIKYEEAKGEMPKIIHEISKKGK